MDISSEHHGSQGKLRLKLAHPPAAFLYQRRRAWIVIDGVKHRAGGWDENEFELAPGPHLLSVWVPYFLPPKAGRVTHSFTVEAGDLVELEYMAPTLTFARGSVAAFGEAPSVGAKGVSIFNWSVLAFFLLLLTVIVIGNALS